ncbi:MAG: hypothetical protein II702_07845 [Clostridia bacterium]|nr:hypothetical protein [Clostridia bacterium]
MDLFLISNIITCLCAFAGFIFGIVKFFAPKKALYAQMITLAVGCMAFGRLYQVVRILTGGEILEEFQLGVLGVLGSLVFLFSANFGLMDSLADDGSKQYFKYRVIPLAAPAAAVAVYAAVFLFGDSPLLEMIVAGILTVFISGASYYNLKHLIFPDVDFGVINCLKTYNLLALVFEFLCVAEMVSNKSGSDVPALIIGVLSGAVLLAITPAVERGMKKWTT